MREYECVNICLCGVCVTLSQSWIIPEKMPFVVVEEREGKRVPVRLLSRERLVCISVACVIGNAVIIHAA